eukprot:Sspe_Gene.61707::Locus_34311_Transcript_1_1_Confidence_1.000_Length_2999::g.61707::m.61707
MAGKVAAVGCVWEFPRSRSHGQGTKMSWGSLLRGDEVAELAEVKQMFHDLSAHAAEVSSKKVDPAAEGRVAMYQHWYDARMELQGLRERLVFRLERCGERTRLAIFRFLHKLNLLLAANYQATSEANVGYQYLERTRQAAERTREHRGISHEDLMVTDEKKTAAMPLFHNIKFPNPKCDPSVDFANLDLLMKAVNSMGVAWSQWGEPNNSQKCFEMVEQLYDHWHMVRKHHNLTSGYTKEEQIQNLLRDAERMHSKSKITLDREKDEQRAQAAAKLAAKRRQRGTSVDEEPQVEQANKSEPVDSAEDVTPMPGLENLADEDELEEMERQIEEEYTKACNGLSQFHRFSGNFIESCFYCHLTLQRESEKQQREALGKGDWVANCIELANFYTIMHDLSHSDYCLKAADLLMTSTTDQEVRDYYNYILARHNFALLKLLQAESEALKEERGGAGGPPPSLDGVVVKLHNNTNFPPPPEERERMQKRPELVQMAAKRMPFKVPILPPRDSLCVDPTTWKAVFEDTERLYRESMQVYTVDTDCERHLLCHLELQEAIAIAQWFIGDGSDTASRRLDMYQQRIQLLQVILGDELDELVFRNVLRQAHFSMGVIQQEIAEMIISQGLPPDRYLPYLEKGVHHLSKFTDRFLHEHREIQKVKVPEKRVATLQLEGSDAPAYVVGEIRHAQLLARFPDPDRKAIVQKYKDVVKFIEANRKARKEYPELEDHLKMCSEMVQLLSEGGDIKTTRAKPILPRRRR